MNEAIKRWTARRKSTLVLEIIQGKRGMENALSAKPDDVRQQYERQLRQLQQLPMAKPCWSCAP